MAHPVTRKPKPLPPLDWRRIWEEFGAWVDGAGNFMEWEEQARKIKKLVERERERVGR